MDEPKRFLEIDTFRPVLCVFIMGISIIEWIFFLEKDKYLHKHVNKSVAFAVSSTPSFLLNFHEVLMTKVKLLPVATSKSTGMEMSQAAPYAHTC